MSCFPASKIFCLFLLVTLNFACDFEKGRGSRPSGATSGLVSASPGVVGGQAVDPSQNIYPFMARLIDHADGSHGCGGALIHESWILTAAHCVDSKNPEDHLLKVALGPKGAQEELLSPVKIILHPKYERRKKHVVWDFALIQVKEKSRFLPIPFSEQDDVGLHGFQSPKALILGWGRKDVTHDPSPPSLMLGELSLQAPSVCDDRYPGRFEETIMICAGQPGAGGVDACPGDSGGPLFFRDEIKGTFLLLGLVSWGDGCFGTPPDYGAYAKVSSVSDWILEEISAAGLINPAAGDNLSAVGGVE